MATSKVEGEGYFHLNNENYYHQLNKIINSILPQFDKIVYRSIFIHCFFLFALMFESLAIICFLGLLIQTSFFALALVLFFLTLFSYLMIRLYLETQKSENYELYTERFARGVQEMINYRDGIPEHHIAMATAYTKLTTALQGREYQYFQPPSWLYSLAGSLEKLSCWCFWKDTHHVKEILLSKAIAEHIKLVKSEPTSLDIHAALANSYVMLSSLYMNPKKTDTYDDDRWVPSNRFTDEDEEKFRLTAEKAIEEFNILNDYAPNDPWVHRQLAYSYHDLQMPEDEIREYEIILKLRPDDNETLFKLGSLYFQQGHNAKGLKAYERLKLANYKKAEHLITFYGADRYAN